LLFISRGAIRVLWPNLACARPKGMFWPETTAAGEVAHPLPLEMMMADPAKELAESTPPAISSAAG